VQLSSFKIPDICATERRCAALAHPQRAREAVMAIEAAVLPLSPK